MEGAVTEDDLILMAWDAVSSDAALSKLLANLASAFGCHSAALFYKDRLTPAADIAVAHGPLADLAVQRRYALEFAQIDPAPAALGRLAVGDVGDTDTLFPEADRHRYRTFLEGFYHPLGLAGALGAPLKKDDARIGMVAVHRGSARRPFDQSDSTRFRRLVPHLARMIEMRQAFFALDAKAARLGDAVEPMTAAIMILDAGGALVEANGAARAIFARRDGLVLTRAGQVNARDPGAARALREAMVSTDDVHLVRVPRDGDMGLYVLRVRHRAVPPGWVITASDPAHGGSQPDRLASALGLTPGAGNLLAALIDGETLTDYCARRHLSRNTAKYHLRAAFAATGTHRQADLVRRATAVVHDLAL